jgi:hypothetical protein
MPYIKQEDRYRFEGDMNDIEDYGAMAETAGELNYLFTKIIKGHIDTYGLTYGIVNDVIGALEGAKLELYRRLAAPYEDEKIKVNGDVYK